MWCIENDDFGIFIHQASQFIKVRYEIVLSPQGKQPDIKTYVPWNFIKGLKAGNGTTTFALGSNLML